MIEKRRLEATAEGQEHEEIIIIIIVVVGQRAEKRVPDTPRRARS